MLIVILIIKSIMKLHFQRIFLFNSISIFIFLDDVNAVLSSTHEQINRLNEHAHKFAFDVVFVHLKRKLDDIPRLPVRFSFTSSA